MIRLSLNDVVQHLESKLRLDLSHKAEFIRAQIQRFLFQQPPLSQSQTQSQSQSKHPPLRNIRNDHFALQQTPNFHPAPSSPTVFSAFHTISFPPVPSVKPEKIPVSSTEALKESGPSKAKRRGRPAGLNKLCGVSPQLEVTVGQSALPRTEQLWAYIRKNNLRDPSNKRKIICNDELRLLFETDCTDMFKMNKLLAKHIITFPQVEQQGSKKQKVDEEPVIIRQAVSAPSIAISEGLANFFGVGVRHMLQSEPATAGMINLNSDAGVKENQGYSAGLTFRDHNGQVMAAAARRRNLTLPPAEAEIEASICGLELAAQLSFSRLHFETDCLEIISGLKAHTVPASDFGTRLLKLRALIPLFTEFVF
ncbi:hypothetical protein JCGZ_00980 [Jatropha curcas]|uniref:DM2 domain-containing protein n=1 Tax=Jatropha curcas TaxID=180498 RepID=A0A067KWA0_JATCU|nr:hypothetical protein JCGZ_00980 [Jatropha curcas]